MLRLRTKIILSLSALLSLSAIAADVQPFSLTVGSSVIGTRENTKQDVHLGFNSLFNALLAADNIKSEFKDFDKSDDLAEAIQKNQVNSMFGSPLEFIDSETYLFSAYVITGLISNQYKSPIILLVRKDSEVNTIHQLKGKKISVQKGVIQDLGGLYLETLLLEEKLPVAEAYFSEIVKTGTSNIALVNLFFKTSDATLMSESEFNIAAELNPQMRLQTRVIHASEPFVNFVAATTNSVPLEKTEAIKKALLNVKKTHKGKTILTLLKVDEFRVVSIDELQTVRTLIAKNKQLKAASNVK